jgi:hypothetical protein
MSDDEYSPPALDRPPRRSAFYRSTITGNPVTDAQILRALTAQMAAIARRIESRPGRERALFANVRNSYPNMFSDLMAQELRASAPQQVLAPAPDADDWIPKGKGGPIVTLVSTLPDTTYKDEDDTKGIEKSLSYFKIQRAVLKYLETKAADTLSPIQARKWTQGTQRQCTNCT